MIFHRFKCAVRLAVFGLLASGIWQTASAERYVFEGVIEVCAFASCNQYQSLGGPMGGNIDSNLNPSDVTGFIDIDVEPNGTFTEANITEFNFVIFNGARPIVDVFFQLELDHPDYPDSTCLNNVGAIVPPGGICNANDANPLPLDNRVVSFDFISAGVLFGCDGGGPCTTGPNNELSSGQLVANFTQPPFNALSAQIKFDLNPANPVPINGFLFSGGLLFTTIVGAFEQLPGEINVADAVFDNTVIGDTAMKVIRVTNESLTNDSVGPLTITSVATNDALAAPFSIATDGDGCTGVTLLDGSSCEIVVEFSPTLLDRGTSNDSFDIVSDDPDNLEVTVNVSGTALEPNLQITPAILNFVATTIGETSVAVATICNIGDADLVLDSIDFSSLDTQFRPMLDNCSTETLVPDVTCQNPEAICQITMEFEPEFEDLQESAFIIPSNDSDMPELSYTVQGIGIDGTIASFDLSATALVFDEILVDETSDLFIQLDSTGNVPLTINELTFSGDNASEFSQSGCPAGELASGSSCTITVTFTPTSGGDKFATLTVDSDADDNLLVDIDIMASAFDGPRIVVDSTLDLASPSAPVDSGSSISADLIVSNTGNLDLTVGTLFIADLVRGGPASTEFTADGCATPVAPMASCTITVTFSPATDADKMAQLFIPSNDVANATVTVSLTGYVFRGPRVSLPQNTDDPGVIDVGGGASVVLGQTSVFDLDITNSGTEDLTITGFALGGDDANSFTFTDSCVFDPPVPVPPQSSCTVTITFMPTTQGVKTAQLSIFSDDVTLVRAATTMVTLTATAVPVPSVPIAAPGSQTVQPPAHALNDPGGGAMGVGLLGLGLVLLIARRRYRPVHSA